MIKLQGDWHAGVHIPGTHVLCDMKIIYNLNYLRNQNMCGLNVYECVYPTFPIKFDGLTLIV